MTIRVVIADDQELMRSALRMCLAPEPDIAVVGEAGDGGRAIELARQLSPDVMLLDIRMPRVDGLQATRALAGRSIPNPTRILMITGFDLDDYLVEALRAGASGFLLKDARAQDVVHAVRVIAAGEALLAPSATRRLLDQYVRYLPSPAAAPDPAAQLTERERAVLRLVSKGMGNAEIAGVLHIAPSSVKTHVGHLLAKLRLADRVHLVIYAYETGFVQPGGRPQAG